MTFGRRTDISDIGYWSEVKLDIVRDYASAYSRILAAQRRPRLTHVYIDAFAGAGYHMVRGSGDLVWGSPMNALLIEPPFGEYHFIDLDRGSVDMLREIVESRSAGPYEPSSVHLHNADCNEILIGTIFPRVRYDHFRRGLLLLDPYGLHLDWRVVEEAGRMRSLELFLNFPMMDMNRNVLRRDTSAVAESQVTRMNRFWGDESWRQAAYSTEGNLFGFEEKTTNRAVVQAFRRRLSETADFPNVSEALPMVNSNGAVVYFLIFASHKPVAAQIVQSIFEKYRHRRG